jgi:hypothetical protein
MDLDINIYKSVILIFTFHGFLLSALMAIGQLIARPNSVKNLILFGLFVVFSLIEFHYLLFGTKLKINHDNLDLLSITAFFLLGPFLYFLTSFSIKKDFKFSSHNMIHFIPAALSIILVLIIIRFLPVKKTQFLFGYFCNLWCFLLGVIASLSFACYLIVVGIIIYKNHLWRREVLQKEPAAIVSLFLFCGFSSLTVSDFLLVATKNEIMMDAAIISFTSFINEYRVNKAKILLKEKHNYTILAIGLEIGFKSKSAFNTAFLRFTGVTPSDYKNKLQIK